MKNSRQELVQRTRGRGTADGFAALAQEDSNHDGVVNAGDANFTNMKVWQDLNQDGVSQAANDDFAIDCRKITHAKS
ncbi:MAG: hypothetical protein HOP24_11270 [Sideroxydans sp.]|nr:hypothetical protein [Sideroxydans sp.]